MSAIEDALVIRDARWYSGESFSDYAKRLADEVIEDYKVLARLARQVDARTSDADLAKLAREFAGHFPPRSLARTSKRAPRGVPVSYATPRGPGTRAPDAPPVKRSEGPEGAWA